MHIDILPKGAFVVTLDAFRDDVGNGVMVRGAVVFLALDLCALLNKIVVSPLYAYLYNPHTFFMSTTTITFDSNN